MKRSSAPGEILPTVPGFFNASSECRKRPPRLTRSSRRIHRLPGPHHSIMARLTFATSEDALKKPGTVGEISPGAELRFIGDDGPRVAARAKSAENLFAHIGQSGFHLSQQAGKAHRDQPRGFHHLGRRQLYRRGIGCVFICDRKRDSGNFVAGWNIYPAEIEAGRCSADPRRARLGRVRHSRSGVRRGVDGGGGAAARRDARYRRHPETSKNILAKKIKPKHGRNTMPTCRGKF